MLSSLLNNLSPNVNDSSSSFYTLVIITVNMISCIKPIMILCSIFQTSVCCNWLRHYGNLSNQSLTLIRQMGGSVTKEDSSIPYNLYEHMETQELETQLVFIRDNLEQIYCLFRHANFSEVTWDTEKTDRFLKILNRQREELNQCVTTKKRDRKVRRYYKRLQTRTLNCTRDREVGQYYTQLQACTLNCTGGSTDSWELIRNATKKHLQLLHMLVGKIRYPSAAMRRRAVSVR